MYVCVCEFLNLVEEFGIHILFLNDQKTQKKAPVVAPKKAVSDSSSEESSDTDEVQSLSLFLYFIFQRLDVCLCSIQHMIWVLFDHNLNLH